MMIDKEDLIIRHFSGELTEEEKKKFNSLLESDTDFKKQVEFEKDLKQVVIKNKNKDLKEKLISFENDIQSKERNKPKHKINTWKIAASIALLIAVAVGWFGYQNFVSVNYNKLYAENYTTYPNTVFTIERSTSDNSIEYEAFYAYEAKNYELAIKKFNEAPNKEHFTFYKAQSYLKLNNLEKADTLFKKVIKDNSEFVAEANWYLALIKLKQKNRVEAINYLDNLTKNYSFKKEQAIAILNKLK